MPKRGRRAKNTSPRFRQIVDDLQREIAAGAIAEHAALPSERAIAERHDVSRMTARRALEAVEAAGLAYSVGRRGRFVSPRRLNYNVSSMANFIEDAKADGMTLDIELVGSRQNKADARLAKILTVRRGTVLTETTRLFRNQGHAIFLETELIVPDRCKDLLPAVPSGGAALPQQRYSYLGHSADIVIRMRALEPDEAAALGLAPHQAGIEQEQVVRDQAGTAYCYNRQIWRGELAQFSARSIVNS